MKEYYKYGENLFYQFDTEKCNTLKVVFGTEWSEPNIELFGFELNYNGCKLITEKEFKAAFNKALKQLKAEL